MPLPTGYLGQEEDVNVPKHHQVQNQLPITLPTTADANYLYHKHHGLKQH